MAPAPGRLQLRNNRRAFVGSTLGQPCGNVIGRASFFEPMHAVTNPAEPGGHTRELALNVGGDVT
jgi:hypothetical protein